MKLSRPWRMTVMSLALLGGTGAAGWAADLVVLESRGANLRPGQTIDSAKALVLKQGQHVTLISPPGMTLELDGPYDKAPDGGQALGAPVASTLQLLVTQRQARLGEVG